MAKKPEAKEFPTIQNSDPKNPYKQVAGLGSVLRSKFANVAVGDAIGIVYLGEVQSPDYDTNYHNYNVKVIPGFTADRLDMTELLQMKADVISLVGSEPVIGVVVDVSTIATKFGDNVVLIICTTMDDIHEGYKEEAF